MSQKSSKGGDSNQSLARIQQNPSKRINTEHKGRFRRKEEPSPSVSKPFSLSKNMEKINDSDSHRKATQSIHEQDDRESRNIILNLDNESFFHPMPMEEQSEPEMNSSSMVALDQEIVGSAALHSLPDSSPMMI